SQSKVKHGKRPCIFCQGAALSQGNIGRNLIPMPRRRKRPSAVGPEECDLGLFSRSYLAIQAADGYQLIDRGGVLFARKIGRRWRTELIATYHRKGRDVRPLRQLRREIVRE